MRPKERRDGGQADLSRARLDQIIDMRHPLAKLAASVDWTFLATRFGASYTDQPGHPSLPTRPIAGLAILKRMRDLSDEALCERWVENPYFQLFCGELRSALERYLTMRKGLGYKVHRQTRRLADFVAFMAKRKATIITTKLAMEWATLPSDRHTSWALRVSDVRGFARHVANLAPNTEAPPGRTLARRLAMTTTGCAEPIFRAGDGSPAWTINTLLPMQKALGKTFYATV